MLKAKKHCNCIYWYCYGKKTKYKKIGCKNNIEKKMWIYFRYIHITESRVGFRPTSTTFCGTLFKLPRQNVQIISFIQKIAKNWIFGIKTM